MAHSAKEGRTVFDNFPCCQTTKSMFADENDFELCDVSFLRLAAESTREMWLARSSEQLAQQARSVAFRALVEAFKVKSGTEFKKRKRKAVKSKSTGSWTEYATAWAVNTSAMSQVGTEVDENQVKNELLNLCSDEQADSLVSKTAAYNTLRNVIQNVAESFVLLDRLTLLKEQGIDCYLTRVTDPAVSPRCVAIVAWK